LACISSSGHAVGMPIIRRGIRRGIIRGSLVPEEAHWHASQVNDTHAGCPRQKRHRCQKRLIGTRRGRTDAGGACSTCRCRSWQWACGRRCTLRASGHHGGRLPRGVGQPRLWPSPWEGHWPHAPHQRRATASLLRLVDTSAIHPADGYKLWCTVEYLCLGSEVEHTAKSPYWTW
jgi:hypothetical protein